jgi:hypothetical protein
VSVLSPFRYNNILKAKHAKIWIFLDWTIPVLVTGLAWGYTLTFVESSCDSEAHFLTCTHEIRLATLAVSFVYALLFVSSQIVTVCSIKARDKNTQLNPQNGINMSKFTRMIVKLTTVKFFLLVPMIVHEVLVAVYDEFIDTNLQIFLLIFVLLCHSISSIITSRFGIWKIKECRLVFIDTFLSWNKRYMEAAAQLRTYVYNIEAVPRREAVEAT